MSAPRLLPGHLLSECRPLEPVAAVPLACQPDGMCRNIRPLHNFEPEATAQEVHDAALQYVRKVSGMTKPSQANAEVFERAVAEIAHATEDRKSVV